MTTRKHKPLNLEIYNRITEVFGTGNAAEVANHLGLQRQSVYQWRDGFVAPAHETLIAMSRQKGVSIHWLLTGEGPMYVSDFPGGSLNADHDLRIWGEVDKQGCGLFRNLPDGKKSFAIKMLTELQNDDGLIAGLHEASEIIAQTGLRRTNNADSGYINRRSVPKSKKATKGRRLPKRPRPDQD